jgi:hypothetical protein
MASDATPACELCQRPLVKDPCDDCDGRGYFGDYPEPDEREDWEAPYEFGLPRNLRPCDDCEGHGFFWWCNRCGVGWTRSYFREPGKEQE